MEQTTRPLADILGCIVALLETIAYQTAGRSQEIEQYLEGVSSRHVERNQEDTTSREERA